MSRFKILDILNKEMYRPSDFNSYLPELRTSPNIAQVQMGNYSNLSFDEEFKTESNILDDSRD